jgi:hypothetical protein
VDGAIRRRFQAALSFTEVWAVTGVTETNIACASHPKVHHITKKVEVCPYRDLSLGYRDPYVGILVPTRNSLPEGTLGNLVLHRNR